ncbi:hypothetical protein BDR03DRAFT_1088657 [Suillus americanus]|nr:hypothetical protein BDR03DRAFT_1088657 [Suillus americanus]
METIPRASRAVRRVALPEMLHTVLLSFRNLSAFVQALHMQAEYAQIESDLCLKYIPHIRNIWMGQFCASPSHSPASVPESELGFLVLVLLSAPPLTIDVSSSQLLTRCLRRAWNDMGMGGDIDHKCSPLPWSTKTLTLMEMKTGSWMWILGAPGKTFLASIPHIIVVPESDLHVGPRAEGEIGPQDYNLPWRMECIPWASLAKGLETLSLAFPRAELGLDVDEFGRVGLDMQVELVTFPTSMVKGDRVPLKFKPSTETGEGCISLDDVHVVVSHSKVHFQAGECRQGWEKVWACGFLTEGGGL